MKSRNCLIFLIAIGAALALSADFSISAQSAKSFVLGKAIKHFAARPGAAPKNDDPQIQKAPAAAPASKANDQLHGAPLEGGSLLEMRDGRLSCRPTTEAEAHAMRRDPGQRLRSLGDEAFTPIAPEQERKGLKIIMRGTPQLEQFPEAKAAFLRAARAWESLIQNPITVVIDVDFGPTNFGKPFRENQFGNTTFQRFFNENAYSMIRSALIGSAGSPQEATIYNLLPPTQLPTDLGAATGMLYHSATMRALGLLPPVADPDAEMGNLGPPPGIAFYSAGDFDFDPSDGIQRKRYDFTALAMHEIGHALGFFSGVGIRELHPEAPPAPEVMDLFRFRPGVTPETFSSAPRILSSGGEHVFFTGAQELPLSTGRDDYTGGDGQQAGHWKDDSFTGRHIGIMDPTLSRTSRYEMTDNDREAFELMGYRTNPLLTPREAELKFDDGTIETGALRNELLVGVQLTPPDYPAKLRKLRILIPTLHDQPDPAGKPIMLFIFAPFASDGQDPLTTIETTVPSANNDLFLEFTIPNAPEISEGDFFVGYIAPSPHEGVGFAVDLSGSEENRSFYATQDTEGFEPLSDLFQGKPANAMIRAIVSTGVLAPTPTPTPIPTPTPTPGPATVALTSGVPQEGYMAQSSPDGSAFETQYAIKVPSAATQLKIDLSANTDLDLYAHFGSRIVIQNGSPVADFKSVSDNNSESITITPASSPALQAGVYYLMVVNYGPGPSTFTITATVTGGTERPVVSVSAASFNGGTLAPEEMVAAYGVGMATGTQVATDADPNTPGEQLPTTLLGTTVKVTDGAGTERAAPLFFVSPSQVNYLIPPGTALGTAIVTVTSGDGTVSVGTAQIAPVAPGLFTANGDGAGAPAASVMRYNANGALQSIEGVTQFDPAQQRLVPRPLSLGESTDLVFLILYGTGLRHRQSLSTVSARIGGVDAPVYYAGKQSDFAGLDQINALLPRSLIGKGEVEVELVVDGKTANKVRINIK